MSEDHTDIIVTDEEIADLQNAVIKAIFKALDVERLRMIEDPDCHAPDLVCLAALCKCTAATIAHMYPGAEQRKHQVKNFATICALAFEDADERSRHKLLIAKEMPPE